MEAYEVPDRDLTKGHRLLQARWPALKSILERELQTTFLVNEVFRSDLRQQWLYGQGRTPEQCAEKGVPVEFAREGLIVTNAWSAKVGAHGWEEHGLPASCALDVIPLGEDGKPWTVDDPWDGFVELTTTPDSPGGQIGLIHFTSSGKVSDKPHLQLREYSDLVHKLILPDFSRQGPGSL